MAETNQLLLNYYKKEETKKIKKLSEEKASLKTILDTVNLDYITKDEVLEILGEDYEQEIENIKDIKEDDFNTSSVIENTPMGKAQEYKKYYEQNNRNRSLTCKDENKDPYVIRFIIKSGFENVKDKMESNIVDTILDGENLILDFNSWQNFVSFEKQKDGSLRKRLETKVRVKVEINVNATNQ